MSAKVRIYGKAWGLLNEDGHEHMFLKIMLLEGRLAVTHHNFSLPFKGSGGLFFVTSTCDGPYNLEGRLCQDPRGNFGVKSGMGVWMATRVSREDYERVNLPELEAPVEFRD